MPEIQHLQRFGWLCTDINARRDHFSAGFGGVPRGRRALVRTPVVLPERAALGRAAMLRSLDGENAVVQDHLP
jgi:hypothetical protein